MLSGPRSTVAKARQLRREPSWPERILWQRLRQRPGGFKVRRQHPAGPYVLDFFYAAASLAVEVDGDQHLQGRGEADERRTQWLDARGVAVLRLSAAEVLQAPDAVIETIVAACLARSSPSTTQLR